MKRVSKILLVSVIALTASLSPLKSYAATSSEVHVSIDGSLQTYEQTAVLIDGSVLVPFRGIFEAFGAGVHWDAKNRRVTAYKDDQIISLEIGSPSASVSDERVHLEQAPRVINGSTMVPVRFVSEALGAEVNWNSNTATVEIKKPSADASDNVYGFALNFPDSWKTTVKMDESMDNSSVLSMYPLAGGRIFNFYLNGIGDPSNQQPFFSIKLFNQTEDSWKTGNHPGYTYLTSKNKLTFAYSLFAKDAVDVKTRVEDIREGNFIVTDDQFNKLKEIYKQLPKVLSSFTLIYQKPTTSTLPSFRSYEGTWTSSDDATISLKFVTDRAAILKYNNYVDTVIRFSNNGDFSYGIYKDSTISMTDGQLVKNTPTISNDGMRLTGNMTTTYKHQN